MKVLLLSPPPVNSVRYTREGRCQEKESILGSIKPPLTLLYIASIARKFGHEVFFLDANAKRLNKEKTASVISSQRPQIIFLATSTSTADMDFRCIPEDFSGDIFVTGAFAKALPEYIFQRHPRIKAVVSGDPEYVAEMLFGPSKGMKEVDGVVIREGGRFVEKPQPSEIEIEELPMPAWDLLDFSEYVLPTNGARYAMVEISRGCPHNCNFCVTSLVHGRKIRHRPAEKVIEEIRELKTKYGIEHFYFLADSSLSGKREVKAFLEAIIKSNLKIKWMSNARLDTIDDEIGKLLADSGCWLLAVGVESGSEAVREGMNKRLSSQDIRKGVAILKKNKIKTIAFYILGAMGDTREKIEETIRFSADLDTTFANFYPAVPYPGTDFFSLCKKENYLTSEDFSRYDYSDYVLDYRNGVDKEFVLSKRKEAYLRFYLRPGKMLEAMSVINPLSLVRCGLSILRD